MKHAHANDTNVRNIDMNEKNGNQEEKRISTGITGLDDVLNGGLPEDHLYLVEGDPGSGKTTLAMQFLLDAHGRGEPVLYVTLSESLRELRAIACSHGWTLDGVDVYEVIPPAESLMPEDQYTVFHPGDVELGTTLKSILQHVEQVKPTRVVFDSLSEIRLLARESSRYRRQVMALKQFFASRHCTALLLDDSPRSEAADTTVLSIVHGVIRLERMAREYGTKRRRLEVVKLRGVKFHDGYHDYDIRTGGIVVHPRLAALHHEPAQPEQESLSGIEELDTLLGGGLDRGTSTLVAGPAGAGKSSIAVQYAAVAAERGEYSAVYLFDEGLTTLFKRARRLGHDVEGCINSGKLHVQQLDPAELSPGDFIHQIRNAVLDRNLRVLVIDSVNGFLNAMPGEHQLLVQLHELLSFLNQRGVVTILVMAQYGILGTGMESPIDISYLADTVILLRYFEAAGKVRKAISVVKKRSGAHEDTVRELKVGPDRIIVGDPLEQFHGVLSGVPTYVGTVERLMDHEGENGKR
ncbi:MAG TPA: ATPase domain-containing protein [Bryobacteraceae bacterium]|nr:ATPase domain-containing protein [Bryobacteraceae bacterium]